MIDNYCIAEENLEKKWKRIKGEYRNAEEERKEKKEKISKRKKKKR